MLWAFRKAEQVVRLFTVGLSFQVLVAVSTDRNDHPHAVSRHANVEAPLAAFDIQDCFFLSNLPRLAVVESADVSDSFMGVISIRFVDAFYLVRICHFIDF